MLVRRCDCACVCECVNDCVSAFQCVYVFEYVPWRGIGEISESDYFFNLPGTKCPVTCKYV